MLEAADAGCPIVLVVLDLPAAFDTIDHAVLLSKFSDTFGVTGTALNLIKSYLTIKISFVKIGSISVLEPLLFTLFTTSLGDIITRFGLLVFISTPTTLKFI